MLRGIDPELGTTTVTPHPFLMALLRGADPTVLGRLLGGPERWDEILEESATHGLIPLLRRRLGTSARDLRPPDAIARRLKGEFATLVARNLVRAAELADILRLCSERRLACAPIRGFALAERIHGDVAARPMGDLDLLVRKDDLSGVATLLEALGYREVDRRPGFAREFSYTLKFVKRRHAWVIVEPHWTIAYPPFVDAIDMDRLWARARRRRVVGVDAWSLAPEETLLNLCLHIAHKQGNVRLLWLYEVDQLLRRDEDPVSWSEFATQVQGAGVGFLVAPALRSVSDFFASPVPDDLLAVLARPPVRPFARRLARLLSAGPRVDGTESLAAFLTSGGLRSRLRYACALLLPSRDFMRMQCGAEGVPALALAYVGRFCFLTREAVKGLAELLIARRRRAASR